MANQIKGTELIRVATKFGDDILSIDDAFRLIGVSTSCKIIMNAYLHKLTILSVYAESTDNRTTVSQKNYTVSKLNHMCIKQLYIFGEFSTYSPLMKFALKCSNVRTLGVYYIYASIHPYAWNLQKLENVYLTTGMTRTHFYLLLELPNISMIQWVANTLNPLKVTTLANYHKNTPIYRDIKLPHIILCCDHEYKDTVTQKCANFTTMRKGCDIIHLDKINTYLIPR